MTDIVDRLRNYPKPERCNNIFRKTSENAHEAAAEIERLRAENASLASWQCEFTDGKTGLVYGEGGSTYCAMAKKVERLRIENIQMQAALGYAICAEDERHIIPSNPFKCGVCDARNKWPNLRPDRQANVAERLFGDD